MAKTSKPAQPKAKKAKPTNTKGKKGGPTNVTKILTAIAQELGLGKDKAEKKRVQVMAGILDKKIFDTVCGSMKKKGLVIYDKEFIELTEAGRDEVGEEALEIPANNDAFHAKIKEQIKSKRSREIFDILADGCAYTKDEIAEKMEGDVVVNKSFGTYLSGLSKFGKMENGKYRLNDDVFPFGRPCDA